MKGFLAPRSVVLIGVSRRSGVGALNNLEMMLRFGYQGRVFLVHPKVPEILGHRTYGSIAELPEVPECAIVSVGRDRVLPVVEDCGRKGIRRVVVISQGFADADAKGRALQEGLLETVHRYGMRLLGPNTMGILNSFFGYSTAFIDLPRDPDPPPLTIVAQSGVLQVGPESFTERVGKAIDIGNAADVDFVDVLDYLDQDPETEIIVVHMEGMKRGRRFLEIASRISKDKPVVVFKTGRSRAGARAALSHTGSLVGEDAIFDASFERAGLIRVANMVELRAVCRAFLGFRKLQGPRLGVLTATGACGIMTADACEDYGLELAPFPEGSRHDLENQRIAWHRLANPVDLWPLGMVSGSFVGILQKAATAMFQDSQTDAILIIAPIMVSKLHNDLRLRETLEGLQKINHYRKPIALWLYGDGAAEEEANLKDVPGIACFSSIDEAVMGLSAVWRYSCIQGRKIEARALSSRGRTRNGSSPTARRSIVTGPDLFPILESYGIPSAPWTSVESPKKAERWAEQQGYPVVLKIVSSDWLHKSDKGGVVMGVSNPEQLRSAFSDLLSRFHAETPGAQLDGILVQRQVEGIELLLGIKNDPQLGPVLVVGSGGIYTEILKDTAHCLVPVSVQEARSMVESLRIYPVLKGARGRMGVDVDGLVHVMLALSKLAWDHDELLELDVNPLLVSADGCWCVDARAVFISGNSLDD